MLFVLAIKGLFIGITAYYSCFDITFAFKGPMSGFTLIAIVRTIFPNNIGITIASCRSSLRFAIIIYQMVIGITF